MKFIPLTNSRFSTIVDDEDYERVMALNTQWRVLYDKDEKPLAIMSTRELENSDKTKRRKKVQMYLSRFLMNLPRWESTRVDHAYHNIFDNRRSISLRLSTASQNNRNKSMLNSNTSGVTGVYLDNRRGTWYSQVTVDKKTKTMCGFKTKEEAIEARKKLEEKYFGEFTYKG